MRKSDFNLNKTRKLAEDLVNKHSALFTTDFSSNKEAVEKVLIIRNRALRNQIAGAITVIMKERSPKIARGEAEEQGEETEAIQITESEASEAHPQETAPAESSVRDTSSAGEQIQQSAP